MSVCTRGTPGIQYSSKTKCTLAQYTVSDEEVRFYPWVCAEHFQNQLVVQAEALQEHPPEGHRLEVLEKEEHRFAYVLLNE